MRAGATQQGGPRRPLSERLVESRRLGRKIVRFGRDQKPRSLSEAYAVADEVAESMGETVGWKIGATSESAQAALGLKEPFFGRITRSGLVKSGAVWRAGCRPLTIDAEFIFQFSRAPQSGAPEAVLRSLAAVGLGLEINDPSYAAPMRAGGLAIVADNGANLGLVCGELRPMTAGESLVGCGAHLSRNDGPSVRGEASAVLGDPLRAVAWLMRVLPHYGLSFRAGDIIASGAVCAIEAASGDRVLVTSDGFEPVSVLIE